MALRLALLAAAVSGTLAASAGAATVAYTSALTTSDPVFNRPVSAATLSATGTAVAYKTYTFMADAGPYSIVGDYTAGGLGAAGLDGYLYLYSTFNPTSPLAGLLAADDDNDPDGAGPATVGDGSLIASAGSYGPATTTTTLTLTQGTVYTLVVAGFSNSTSASGVGAFTVTVSGAAPTTAAVPLPASAGMGLAGLAGLGLRRRR